MNEPFLFLAHPFQLPVAATFWLVHSNIQDAGDRFARKSISEADARDAVIPA
jgi:hypothetical protein